MTDKLTEKRSRLLCHLNLNIASFLATLLFVHKAVNFLDLHAVLSHSNSNRTLSSTSTDQNANTRSVHCTKRKLAPDSGFEKRMLPFQARHHLVRRLSLIGPDSFDDIEACILAPRGAEKQLKQEYTRARRDESVEEQRVREEADESPVLLIELVSLDLISSDVANTYSNSSIETEQTDQACCSCVTGHAIADRHQVLWEVAAQCCDDSVVGEG
jgi:hypothetical protein